MSTILFYAPFDRRSRDTESLMVAFREQGHRVMFLTQRGESEITQVLRKNDVECFTQSTDSSGIFELLRQVWFFTRFCRRHHVDVVYSHLASASFVAVFSQFFIKGRVVVCRHHVDESALKGVDRNFSYRMTYRWARNIIVVSRNAKRYMVEQEGIDPQKIHHIDLAYDFKLFESPDARVSGEIRKSNPCELFLLMACRLTSSKRPALAIHLMKKLRAMGINAKLIILGEGELMNELKSQVTETNLADHVQFTGLVRNVPDYLDATDVLVHPSISESSCVIVKEAGLAGRPVVVCRSVGDFDEYLEDGKNAFMTDKDEFVEQAALIIKENLLQPEFRARMGEQLGRTIRERFAVSNMLEQYAQFNKPS